MLKLLQQTHMGMSKMKGLARSYKWWPGMDENIEREVKACEKCQIYQKSLSTAPLHPWECPESLWLRIHVNYAGPFLSEMFLLIVDAHSKWMDIYLVKWPTSQETIEKLRQFQCVWSAENVNIWQWNMFHECRVWDIHEEKWSWPCEVSTCPPFLKWFSWEGSSDIQGDTLQTRPSRFLVSYHITPQATTPCWWCDGDLDAFLTRFCQMWN